MSEKSTSMLITVSYKTGNLSQLRDEEVVKAINGRLRVHCAGKAGCGVKKVYACDVDGSYSDARVKTCASNTMKDHTGVILQAGHV